jgi:Zn-dependent protease
MNILSLLQHDPISALAFLLSIVLAITVHEFAHAWTAWKLGDDTPYLMGRVSLSPFAHLDPIGSIAFLLIGFGWGKPVLYNPMRLSKRVYELFIALAGPASNLLLGIFLNLLVVVLAHFHLNVINLDFLRLAAFVNVLLASFNMLPIPPLDGSSIIAYFWPEYRSLLGGQLGLIVLLALILIPVGAHGESLISLLVVPVRELFSHITTLFGLLGSYGF